MKEAKILREKSRTYKERIYYKHKVNIPDVILAAAGFKAGDNIELTAEKGIIMIKKHQNPIIGEKDNKKGI